MKSIAYKSLSPSTMFEFIASPGKWNHGLNLTPSWVLWAFWCAVGLRRKEVSSTFTSRKKGVIPSHTAQKDGFPQTSHSNNSDSSDCFVLFVLPETDADLKYFYLKISCKILS